MKKQTESMVLENKEGLRLRIYKVEGDGPISFCIGVDGDETHFEFGAGDAEQITAAIDVVVDSFA